jgi:multicomponent Na+:H+ antiporter subunit E
MITLSVFRRFLLFTLLWMLLSEAEGRDIVIATAGILFATIFSQYLWPRPSFKLQWSGLPDLVFHFLWSSLKGGIDIGYRALAPSMPLHPALIRLECKLDSEAGLVLFTWMISLMPGTAGINLEQGNHLTVHVVDIRVYSETNIRALEKKIARFIHS